MEWTEFRPQESATFLSHLETSSSIDIHHREDDDSASIWGGFYIDGGWHQVSSLRTLDGGMRIKECVCLLKRWMRKQEWTFKMMNIFFCWVLVQYGLFILLSLGE